MNHLRLQSSAAGALCVALLAASTARADITGKWHISPLGTVDRFVDIVQSGTAVTINFTMNGMGPFPLTGGITGNDYSVGADPGACVSLSGSVLPSGNTLDGQFVSGPPTSCFPISALEFVATRCTCFDGNSTDGDGCSAECQVEPCFTCTGNPSVCTPSADGAACDDGNICTTGETCSVGICGGGSPVVPCSNMTGGWHLHEVGEAFGSPFVRDLNQTIAQLGTDLFFTDNMGSPTYVGTIDPATGAFTARTANNCVLLFSSHFDGLSGTVAPDGNSFAGVGSQSFMGATSCPGVTFDVTATRSTCGNGIIEAGETCDDNNQVAGDGCDADCQVEACHVCSGAPSVCGFAPSGTACGASDACTVEACNASGTCVASPVDCDDGHACTLDSCSVPIGCIHTPKVCRSAQRSELDIGQPSDPARDTLLWKWGRGQATSQADFADPRATATYDFCVFAGTSAALVDEVVIAPSVQRWAQAGSRGFTYKDPTGTADGIRKIRLGGSAADRAEIVLTGKGAGLPIVPLPMAGPIIAQLENGDTSVCWSASYVGSQIVRDDQGGLKAKFKNP